MIDRLRLISSFSTALLLLLLLQPSADAAGASPPNVREMKTAHYHIYTDLDPRLAADLAQRLDAMYDAYAYRLSDANTQTYPYTKASADSAPAPVTIYEKETHCSICVFESLHFAGNADLLRWNPYCAVRRDRLATIQL
jgi:hypothetical protein